MNNRAVSSKMYTRSVVAIVMLLAWSITSLTGFLLWMAPTGPRSGRMLLVLGLTKREWGDYHFYFALVALIITVIHIIIDWKGLRRCLVYLISTGRGDE